MESMLDYAPYFERTIEGQLHFAPKLLRKLKRKHGDSLSIGEITNAEPPRTGGPAEPVWYKSVEILVNGKPIGVYRELQYIDGPSSTHEFLKGIMLSDLK